MRLSGASALCINKVLGILLDGLAVDGVSSYDP